MKIAPDQLPLDSSHFKIENGEIKLDNSVIGGSASTADDLSFKNPLPAPLNNDADVEAALNTVATSLSSLSTPTADEIEFDTALPAPYDTDLDVETAINSLISFRPSADEVEFSSPLSAPLTGETNVEDALNVIAGSLGNVGGSSLDIVNDFDSWENTPKTSSSLDLVKTLGLLDYRHGADDMLGEGIYASDGDAGRGFLELPHLDYVLAHIADLQAEVLPAVIAVLDFPNIPGNSVEELTVTVPGALPGDGVVLGAPGDLEAGLVFSGLVSADDTVTIRLANITGTGIDPAEKEWSARVIRPETQPIIPLRAAKIYFNLLSGAYDDISLDAELNDGEGSAAFLLLLNSRKHRADLLDSSTIEGIIQSSTLADNLVINAGGYN